MSHNNQSNDTFFVIAKKDSPSLVTSVLQTNNEEVVLVFTSDAAAQTYLQQAGWSETETSAELDADGVHAWLTKAQSGSVKFVAVNPDRVHQTDDMESRVLVIADLLKGDAQSVAKQLHDAATPAAQ